MLLRVKTWSAQALMLACILLASASSSAQTFDPARADDEKQSILVLMSYHPSFSASAPILDALVTELGEEHYLYIEFMDALRDPYQRAPERMRAALLDKYGAKAFDMVVTFGDPALRFLSDERDELFGETPVVFGGVRTVRLAGRMASRPQVTGVMDRNSMDATLALARALHGDALQRLVGIHDVSTASQAKLRAFERLRHTNPDLEFSTLSMGQYSFAALETILAGNASEGLVYINLDAYADAQGAFERPDAWARRFTPASARPIYSQEAAMIAHGAVGGDVITDRHTAHTVIGLAQRILGGEDANAVRALFQRESELYVNVKSARRHGLDVAALGEDVQQLNAPATLFERNQNAIMLTLVALGLALFALACVTVASRQGRRRLQALNEQLTKRHEELVDAHSRLDHSAHYDSLTGLANRRFARGRLATLLEPQSGDGAGAEVVVLHIDLSRFKPINDTLGHAAGDHVLQTIAQRLSALVPASGFVSRTGGDEFTMAFPARAGATVEPLLEQLFAALEAPVVVGANACRLSGRVGVARAALGALSAEELLRRADLAAMRAAEAGERPVATFSEKDERRVRESRQLAEELALAVESRSFEPFYQPQICAQTGRVVGLEALARWQHPERGMIAPGLFMGAAEKIGLIGAIDRIILEKASEDVGSWRAAGFHAPKLSVNVSTRRLTEPGLLESLADVKFGGTRLCFELLESIFLDDASDAWLERIDALRERGVEVEIDDFGTGHASIVGLLQTRPDRLKIARELVAPIESAEERLQLVRSIVEIGSSLGIGVVAEGVETDAQRDLLARVGCHVLQGYVISRPQPASAIPALAARLDAAAMAAA